MPHALTTILYPCGSLSQPTSERYTRSNVHSMGIDDLSAVDEGGRPYSLLEEGEVLHNLF